MPHPSRHNPALVRLALALLFALLTGLAACTPDDPDAEHPGRVPGVTEATIRLGSSLPLTGHARYLGVC